MESSINENDLEVKLEFDSDHIAEPEGGDSLYDGTGEEPEQEQAPTPTPIKDLPDNVKRRIRGATWFARQGCGILRVHPGAKKPSEDKWQIRLLTEGYAIQRMLSTQDSAGNFPNYGICPRDRMVIVDTDNGMKRGRQRTGEKNLTAIGDLPPTVMTRTPSGGFHRFYKVPAAVTNSHSLPEDVDVRGQTGQVVGIGCELIEGLCKETDTPGTYERADDSAKTITEAPDWLVSKLSLFTDKSTTKATDQKDIIVGDTEVGGDPAELSEVRDALSFIDFTMRDDQDGWAGLAKSILFNQLPIFDKGERIEGDVAEELCFDAMSGRLWGKRIGKSDFYFSSYQGRDELKERLKDGVQFTKGGKTLGTIFDLATTGGWKGQTHANRVEQLRGVVPVPSENDPPVTGKGGRKHSGRPRALTGKPDFQLTEKEKLAKTFSNTLLALRHTEPLPEHDIFNERVVLRDGGKTYFADDKMYRIVREGILRDFSLELSRDNVIEALHTIAYDHPFHPVRDYFKGLTWDGTERLDSWLTDFFGVEDSEYTRAVGRLWLLAGVTRIYRPGMKFDFMLVFTGQQGISKSKALRVLAVRDEWFSDSPPDDLRPDNMDAVLGLQGKLIIEFSELASLKKASRDTLKSFISRQIDEGRVPYGRAPQSFPRQCIFAGSTNEAAFLEDPTGGRRFWPVDVPDGKRVDVAGLLKVRDQLWAEAVTLYNAGELPELPERLWGAAGEVQEGHLGIDPWEDTLKSWLNGKASRPDGEGGPVQPNSSAGPTEPITRVHTGDLLDHALNIPTERQTSTTGRRLRPIMVDRLGWKYHPSLWIGGINRGGYTREGVEVPE